MLVICSLRVSSFRSNWFVLRFVKQVCLIGCLSPGLSHISPINAKDCGDGFDVWTSRPSYFHLFLFMHDRRCQNFAFPFSSIILASEAWQYVANT